MLENKGYEIAIYEPHIERENFVDFNEAIEGSNLILILADHNEFKEMDYESIKDKMETSIIFDTKNILEEVPKGIELYNYGNLYKLN